MTRLQADLLLLLTALIWGTAFIAQKTGMDGLGPLAFAGIRFVLSFVFILPMVWLEWRRAGAAQRAGLRPGPVIALCMVFAAGVVLQQVGILHTTVTNAGFLTGLYVLGVPFAAWVLFRTRPDARVWLCGLIAVTGIWFLNGGSLTAVGYGDFLILLCAVCFAVQVALLGLLVQRSGMPLTLSLIQYGGCATLALMAAFTFETVTWNAVMVNAGPLLYAGVVSGGVAYTLQAVAQRHTPPADAAVILSGEGLFAALAGAVLLGEVLGPMGFMGCALIMLAILLVEVGPAIRRHLSSLLSMKGRSV